ncbi:MAG: hypothetical protein JO256_11570 [Alphaproteobacteria bacterium]|nr:hypothetical protein [Alphaproteobacteria bacterium]
MHPAQRRKQQTACLFPAAAVAGQKPSRNGRGIKRLGPALRLEQGLAQDAIQFATRKGPALAEGRGLNLRPQAGAIGSHDQQPRFRRHHLPQLAQQRAETLGPFQAMHDQDAIKHGIGERQRVFLAFHSGAGMRSMQHADGRRDGSDGALGPESSKIRCGEAEAQKAQTIEAGPEAAQLPQNDAARDLARAPGVKGGDAVGIRFQDTAL